MKIATALIAATLLSSGAAAQTTAPQAPQSSASEGGLGGLGGPSGLGGLGGSGGLGGLGGLLGGSLPSVGSIGAGNAAGLLGYCLKNNLLGQGGALAGLAGTRGATSSTTAPETAPATPRAATGARSIFERLAGKQGVQSSPAFAAGQAGQVVTPNGQGLALGNLGGQLKTRLCSVVLNRAKSFL